MLKLNANVSNYLIPCVLNYLTLYVIYLFIAKKLPQDVNPKAVFACNELDLKEVKVYGFDYDYTLACYTPSLDYLLYNLGRQTLIEQYKVRLLYNLIQKLNEY